MIEILSWYFLLFLLGSFCLPLTLKLFSSFWDQGYPLAKIISLVLVSYLVWLLGSLKLLPFTQKTAWGTVICLGIINLLIIKNLKLKIKNCNAKFKIFLFEECLFLVCLIFWSLVRGFQPDIHGLEKYMDFGFVNSILRSRFFPPQDMWMAGKTINYYYFGHLVAAVLTKLSGIDSAITYNLMIATIFSLCFTAAFSLASNLVSLVIGHWSLVIFAGLLSAALLTLGGNLHLLWYFLKHHSLAGYWYPDATRFIVEKFGALDNTIHEFPVYSFVVADLHGHLLDLPFVLLFLSLLLVIFKQKKVSLFFGFLVSLLLAVFYMTNAWDFPIYFLVLALGLRWRVVLSLLLAILYSLPFHLHFRSIAQGVALVDFHSPAWMLLVLWGFPLFITLNFLVTAKRQKVNYFVWILLAVSWFLIFIPEIFYVKDIYIHSFQRANTMFKLTYQSFVMFAIVSGYIMVRGMSKKLLFTFYFLLFTFIISYSFFAVRSYYGLKNYQGLNGIKYLDALYPDDYQAILWLRNVKDQPVILEAVGDSYTDFARVSANTGLATVLGWPVHEWLWRGSYDEPGQRREEVRKIYELEDLEETRNLLKRYNIDYVFIGELERKAYQGLKEEKFNRLGKVVFQQGETKIYKLE